MANAYVVRRHCACNQEALRIIALRPILPSEPLRFATCIARVTQGSHICLQFDGTCLQPGPPNTSAGAGTACWLLEGDRIQLIDNFVVLLPDFASAPGAEAAGSSWTIAMLGEVLLRYTNQCPLKCRGITRLLLGIGKGLVV